MGGPGGGRKTLAPKGMRMGIWISSGCVTKSPPDERQSFMFQPGDWEEEALSWCGQPFIYSSGSGRTWGWEEKAILPFPVSSLEYTNYITHTHSYDSTHRPHTQRAVMMGDKVPHRNFEGTGTHLIRLVHFHKSWDWMRFVAILPDLGSLLVDI